LPSGKHEIIVVDNCSTDQTREVVGRFESSGRVRYIFEGSLGISSARNTGWKTARGRYVAYLDDDAIASPRWLATIEEAFATMPDARVVGGRVEPIWEGSRPVWLSDDIALSLAILNWSDSPKVISDLNLEWLVTANMAISSTVLAEIGGFNTKLGRIGKSQIRGEDCFLQKQIIRRGYTCLYYPEMMVHHHVLASRLTKQWFRHRYFTQGIANARVRFIELSPPPAQCVKLAALAAGRLLLSPQDLFSLILPTNDPTRFTRKCFAWITVGYITGLLKEART
jgi:glycosyltransferase involved in cell wall biosynthesis